MYTCTNNLRLEKCDASRLKILLDDEVSQTITYYDPQDFKILSEVSSGASALVYNVCREDTTMFAIKKFRSSSKEAAIVNEIFLTGMASPYPSIIQFYGLTKLQDETNYSLVLEYAEGGTLKQYLRDNAVSFGWKNQLRFAKEIASAISWLHNVVGIIHADLHPDNILISKGTIKLADFGCSYLKGSKRNTQVRGVIPYMDPNFFEHNLCSSETQNHPYPLTEKADIYSLGVLFWELTSRKSPFDFETKNNDNLEIFKIMSNIFNGTREKPSPGTNHKFVALYEKCWQHEPHERPEVSHVISELNNIVSDNFSPKDNIASTTFTPKKGEANEDLYLSD
ncbi:kinase-like domain-containing protein [Rhizophagus irregularis DAOM 181602=DAOM 197198]|nr:kinase-like protein [Rhizophagus irregularis]GBC46959.1 kinase-like domain-containing protein [Rhizophagus irregularis DAOM 181602=DAOM 197198]CAB4492068.1 unnamed protein product [Rhizophagus irregularis]